ncbi:MAG: hypothetical protein ACJ78M_13950 [Gemmatimonadaceae bacterium]
MTATRDPGVERIHPIPLIEPSSIDTSSDGGGARSRTRLAVEYIRARRKLAGMVLLAAAVVGTSVALLLPSKYTARASFYSESKQGGSDLSSFSSLGPLTALLSAAGGSLGNGPTFFVDLLKSQSFFDSLAVSPIPIVPNGPPVLVKNYVIKKAKNDSIRMWKARIKLKKMIDVSTQPSGVVVVRVDAKSPVAAAAIANRSVDLIDNLNQRFRRDQAAARRRFTQGFLADVEARLDASEDRLQGFLLNNRSLLSMRSSDQSPVLKRQEERLRAETLRLTALKEQLESTIENARLTEYNDAPMVGRVDRASVPEKRSGPPRTLISLGAVLLAATFIFFFAYLRAPRSEGW